MTSASPGGQAQGVHGDVDRALEVPGAGGLDLRLEVGLPGAELLVVGVGVGPPGHDLVVLGRAARRPGPTPSITLPCTSLAGSSWGSCSSRPTVKPGVRRASPVKPSSTPAMIRSSDDLPEPLAPSTPILAPGIEGEGDVLEHLAVRRVEPADLAHGEDELRGHGTRRYRAPGEAPNRRRNSAGRRIAATTSSRTAGSSAVDRAAPSRRRSARGQRLRRSAPLGAAVAPTKAARGTSTSERTTVSPEPRRRASRPVPGAGRWTRSAIRSLRSVRATIGLRACSTAPRAR